MRGSLKLFTWFGIPVHLHWTFALIFIFIFYQGYSQGAGLIGMLWFIGLFIALFGCVLLHEFGHSLTARRFGVQTQDIILTPIGGIARLERMPEKPIQEFLVAIMGPAVNVVIAILLLIIGKLMFSGLDWAYFKATVYDFFVPILAFFQKTGEVISGDLPISQFSDALSAQAAYSEAAVLEEETNLEVGGFLMSIPTLLSVNLWLVLFNMIPAFPMDGGRVFRSLMAMRIGRIKATAMASRMGQALAVIFVILGLWSGNFILALIGFFVFSTARSENTMVQLDEVLKKYTARDLMRTQYTRLLSSDWIQTPIQMLSTGLERHFLVFDMSENLLGALDESSILEAIKKRDLNHAVGDYMQAVETVNQRESLHYIFYLMRGKGMPIVAVADELGICGVIDAEGLSYFLKMKQTKG
jgi:Zn-dependent protease